MDQKGDPMTSGLFCVKTTESQGVLRKQAYYLRRFGK